jgi:aspartyl-tRNA(Asn)/glutamyl-tRNA(Gln) amidotransferase subunit C
MSLSRKDVEELALLARLELAPAELDAMQAELATLLAHFDVIAQLDTTDVTHAVPTDLPLRADVPAPSLPASVALAGAPKREGDLFVVPAIITRDGADG